MSENIPKNPFLFGIFVTKPHIKWAITALISVFIATALDRFSVVILRNLTDSIAAENIIFSTVWFWAILYPVLNFGARNVWRASGFAGMRWFTGFRSSAYQTLYEYLSLHSKDYFNSRFAGSLTNKISNAADGTVDIFQKMLWQFIPLIIGLFRTQGVVDIDQKGRCQVLGTGLGQGKLHLL